MVSGQPLKRQKGIHRKSLAMKRPAHPHVYKLPHSAIIKTNAAYAPLTATTRTRGQNETQMQYVLLADETQKAPLPAD